VGLGFELRVSPLLNRKSTICESSLFCFGCFGDRVLQAILLISASQVDRITVMCHRHSAYILLYVNWNEISSDHISKKFRKSRTLNMGMEKDLLWKMKLDDSK
jgi:hypothetical protein